MEAVMVKWIETYSAHKWRWRICKMDKGVDKRKRNIRSRSRRDRGWSIKEEFDDGCVKRKTASSGTG